MSLYDRLCGSQKRRSAVLGVIHLLFKGVYLFQQEERAYLRAYAAFEHPFKLGGEELAHSLDGFKYEVSAEAVRNDYISFTQRHISALYVSGKIDWCSR